MMTDAKLAFVPIGSPLSLTAGTVASPLIVDLLGNGAGTTVTNIYGNSTLPGQADAMGVGAERPELAIAIGTALVSGGGATLNIQLQAAPDNGSGSPGTYQTLGESGALTVAQCPAATVVCRLPWLPPFPFNLRPRFIRLNFVVATSTFSAGTIASALVTTVRDDQFQLQAAKNYTIGPLH